MSLATRCDVAIIGAGPAGAVAAALLSRRGFAVTVLEREYFPRFSIGESLLPQSMAFLEEAGMLPAIEAAAPAAGFQPKDGAAFQKGDQFFAFDFADKVTPGWSRTYQVKRADFDKVLADAAAEAGAAIHYGYTITAYREASDAVVLSYTDPDGQAGELQADFCLDASGFGRVLPRLLDLNRPSDFPIRQAVFTHVVDHIVPGTFDRDKILITVHPEQPDIWFWLIPFSDGTCSLGVVGEAARFKAVPGTEAEILRHYVDGTPSLARLLARADFHQPVRTLAGYTAKVSAMYGARFALLGNAGEFLDPIFSSGVTIALKSSSLAVAALERRRAGLPVDWEADFAAPLARGVDTFRYFVSGWYDGSLQDVIFAARAADPKVRQMICAILAGYAWDEQNPLVARTRQRLAALAEICRGLA